MRHTGVHMGFLIAIVVIAGLSVVVWLITEATDAVGNAVSEVADKTVYGQQRDAGNALGAAALRIRTSIPSDTLWQELAFRLTLPTGKPKYSETLYIAGELPSSMPGNHAMRVDWNECVQSIVAVTRDDRGATECEHAMLQWIDNGRAMRGAPEQYQALRSTLVSIVTSLDPGARAVLVDEHDREQPFANTFGV